MGSQLQETGTGRSVRNLDLSDAGRREWRQAFEQLPEADIYYHPGYSEILQRNGEGEARCLVVRDGEALLLQPFMVRPIPSGLLTAAGIGTPMFDTATPYGYGGPAVVAGSPSVEQEIVDESRRALRAEFDRTDVVSEFVRFHPILENHRFRQRDLELRRRSETVLFDLTLDPDTILGNMIPQARNKTRKALRSSVRIELDEGFVHLDAFHRNYLATMRRARAPERYNYPIRFFHDHVEMLRGNVFLFVALHGEHVIHSALILLQGPHAHYHFSGADQAHPVPGANNLLLYEVARWARDAGARTLHLGGGRTTDDSLFTFKASLSPARRDFWTGTAVHNHEVYARLTRAATPDGTGDPGFFPAYRQ